MAFTFNSLAISGLWLIEPKVFSDPRGYFLETYNQEEFRKAGLTARFVQDNRSRSSIGVLRGLHFQRKHPQCKLVQVLLGEVWDVAVDLRTGSPTFGQVCSVLLSSENKLQFYIPEAFAHGFLVVSDEAELMYKCTDFYHPEDEGGIRWDDPELAIPWPGIGSAFVLSEKDRSLPSFDRRLRYFEKDFDW